MTGITTEPLSEIAPEPPPKGPVVWARDNLFNSVTSSILTVGASALVLFTISPLLNFLMAPDRRWDAVTANLRLLMVQAYPQGQTGRVWVSVGIIAVLLALTLAVFRAGGYTSRAVLSRMMMLTGGAIAGSGVLGYLNLGLSTSFPYLVVDAGGGSFSGSALVGWVVVGALLLVIGYGLGSLSPDRVKEATIPILGLVGLALIGVIVALWTVPVPVPTVEGTIEYESAASTTALPWTVIVAVAIASYFLGLRMRQTLDERLLRRGLVGLWVASFPVIVLVILRDPEIDYGKLFGSWLWIALAFALLGAALLNYLASPGVGEVGRAIAGLLVVVSIGVFFFSMPFLARLLVISLALFALAAPTFGGEGATRIRYLGTWVATVVILTYALVLITGESTVDVPGSFFLGGLSLTFVLAITSISLSFPLGVLLALGRTSTMPIFRLVSTAYIELVRGVPLITWLLVAFLMLPVALPEGVEIGGVVRAIGAITFFSAAYLAENVRGGLQSIPKGQYEAARAVGMTTVQMTVFITMPQALRAVIPALVGQVIALFKDTSLVTIVGLFDFLHISRAIIPTQTQPFNFLGSIKETLIFAAVVYWIFTFSTSRLSLRLEKKLGVGER